MPYNLDFSLVLGSSKIGVPLQAQFVDSNGIDVGSPVTTGFVEIGLGNYLWHGTIPSGFQGGIKFEEQFTNELLAFSAVNPSENEGVTKLSLDGLDDVYIEDGLNMRQALSIMAAALGGILRQTDAGIVTVSAVGNPNTNRITAEVNTKGERTAISLNIPV